MNYKITTLAENSVYGKGLQGEHGLSLLVEAGEHKVLFDTGASDLFLRNARLLGLDLSEVEYVVLSHGHRDHTGGLYAFLKMNSVAKVVCKREVFRKKFKNERENGMLHPEALDKSRFWLVDETTEIVPGVFAFPDVKVVDRNDTHFEHFFTEIEGEMRPDTFEDELALVLKGEKSLSVLSACSHPGDYQYHSCRAECLSGIGTQTGDGRLSYSQCGRREVQCDFGLSGYETSQTSGSLSLYRH